jgi:hypothetical protein
MLPDLNGLSGSAEFWSYLHLHPLFEPVRLTR